MESVLKNLVGQKVLVWSGEQGQKDEGMLEGYDEQFVRIKDGKGQDLYFSIAHIRLIKPIR